MASRKMHLMAHVASSAVSHHAACWRDPSSDATEVLTAERYQRLAQIYERGMFDGIFMADIIGIDDIRAPDDKSRIARAGVSMCLLDPTHILTAMAAATSKIGVSATVSTSLLPAYYIARSLATIDHLSGGRVGWNIVTSSRDEEAWAYGLELLPREQRYEHADQVVRACLALWHSWAPDAMKVDRENGIFADPDLIKYVDIDESHLKMRGSFATPRPPQGHPVLMQAGASEAGRNFSAKWAEVIYTIQRDIPSLQTYYADIKERVQRAGRRPENCLIFPSIDIIVGQSESEAREKAAELDGRIDIKAAIAFLSRDTGKVDLTAYDPDMRLDAVDLSESARGGTGIKGIFDNLQQITKNQPGVTIAEVARMKAVGDYNPRLIGTPKAIADEMEAMFMSGCCDGYVVCNAPSPRGPEDFVNGVIPELQRRGLFRTEYRGTHFRDHLQE